MDKKTFANYINKIMRLSDLEDQINNLVRDVDDLEGYHSYTWLQDDVLGLLEEIMDDTQDSLIGYFVYELNFGREYRDGCIEDADGTPIKITTPEELYDELERRKHARKNKI